MDTQLRRLIYLLTAVVMICEGCVTDPSVAERRDWDNYTIRSFLETDYEPVHTMAEIPSYVIEAFCCLTMDKSTRFANPGEDFIATDVIDRDAPSRRLMVAGKSVQSWFIVYAKGGIAAHISFVILDADDAQHARVRWAGILEEDSAFGVPLSVPQVKDVVRRGSIWKLEYKDWLGNF